MWLLLIVLFTEETLAFLGVSATVQHKHNSYGEHISVPGWMVGFELSLSETGPDIQEIRTLGDCCGRNSQTHIVLMCSISCYIKIC